LSAGSKRIWKNNVKPREQWRPMLEAEVRKWSAKSASQLLSELSEVQAYQIDVDGKKYEVEVQLLENTDTYVHVEVDVDDGSIPASFHPLSSSFIREK
jgi:hypothetical protein